MCKTSAWHQCLSMPKQSLYSRQTQRWNCRQFWEELRLPGSEPGSRLSLCGSMLSADARCLVMPTYACTWSSKSRSSEETCTPSQMPNMPRLALCAKADKRSYLAGCDDPTAVRRALAASRWRPRVALSLANASRSCRASSRCAAAALAAFLASSSALLASCARRLACKSPDLVDVHQGRRPDITALLPLSFPSCCLQSQAALAMKHVIDPTSGPARCRQQSTCAQVGSRQSCCSSLRCLHTYLHNSCENCQIMSLPAAYLQLRLELLVALLQARLLKCAGMLGVLCFIVLTILWQSAACCYYHSNAREVLTKPLSCACVSAHRQKGS